MSFPEIAIWFSVAPILIGTVFMLTAKKQVTTGYTALKVFEGMTLAPEVGGLMVHVFFVRPLN